MPTSRERLRQAALEYHSTGRKGKIEVVASKPCSTQRDLSLAYTPGVAEPCLDIAENPELAYSYTAKGNLVAVVSNGTATLGLGDIGALACKPVMEGKGVLFKRFADIDVFDIELDTKDPDEIIKACTLLEPTFGGINLEDIKAPECFYIEETLKKALKIPVFHDDQHGTAIISAAALLNALEIVGKDIDKVRVVFNGAGAAGIACAQLYLDLGVKKENIMMCDSVGVIYRGREKGMNDYKQRFAVDTKLRTLEDAMMGADVFCGVSVKGAVSPEMVKSMGSKPIVFAMANPDPEITPAEVFSVRKDVIMATGRSDYPNQVNNVLGFPFIFRGALDVRATAINNEMKIAAVKALALLAKQDVPDSVCKAYAAERFAFGPDYIIPKPFDPRVLLWETPAVAKAAMDSGVAKTKVDLEQYQMQLEARLGKSKEIMRHIINKARVSPKRIVFPEGEQDKILRTSQILVEEKIAHPILLGNEAKINARIQELGLELNGVEIINPTTSPKFEDYAGELYRHRQRQGMTLAGARERILDRNTFGAMMVHREDADGLVSGLNYHYADTIKPALQIIKMRQGHKRVSGLYMMVLKKGVYFFADTTVNIEPTAEDLAEIAVTTAEMARRFDVEPRVAMLSFSNFGSTRHPLSDKVAKAVKLIKNKAPDLVVDGEMQADTALSEERLTGDFEFCTLKGPANVLIFPDLQSGNIAYKLMYKIGGAEAIGPILMGMRKPVHVLQRGAEVNDIVNMAAIAVVDAQELALMEEQKMSVSVR
jgi:malate dehydrogenase (oxaloacetate-decarboxylating)(NADP+)